VSRGRTYPNQRSVSGDGYYEGGRGIYYGRVEEKEMRGDGRGRGAFRGRGYEYVGGEGGRGGGLSGGVFGGGGGWERSNLDNKAVSQSLPSFDEDDFPVIGLKKA
jgi:hypothetical protein